MHKCDDPVEICRSSIFEPEFSAFERTKGGRWRCLRKGGGASLLHGLLYNLISVRREVFIARLEPVQIRFLF
jgi:hypothetical protein